MQRMQFLRRWRCKICGQHWQQRTPPAHEHETERLCDRSGCANTVPAGVKACSEMCGLQAARERRGLRPPVCSFGRGQWLFEERRRRDLDRSELAELVGAHPTSVYFVEMQDDPLPAFWMTRLRERWGDAASPLHARGSDMKPATEKEAPEQPEKTDRKTAEPIEISFRSGPHFVEVRTNLVGFMSFFPASIEKRIGAILDHVLGGLQPGTAARRPPSSDAN